MWKELAHSKNWSVETPELNILEFILTPIE